MSKKTIAAAAAAACMGVACAAAPLIRRPLRIPSDSSTAAPSPKIFPATSTFTP